MKQFRFSFLMLLALCTQIAKPNLNSPTIYDCIQFAHSIPALREALRYFTTDTNLDQTYPDASEEISAFIHDLLKFHKVQNPESVKIKLGPKYISGNNTIVIEWLFPGSSVSHLESLIYHYNNQELFPDYNFENLLNQMHHNIGSIEHEISHIKNKDCKKHALSLAAFSILSYLSLKLFLEKKIPEYFPSIAKISQDASWELKIPYALASGTALYLINKHACYWLSRNKERSADANISDNPDVLIAKINWHTEIHDGLKNYVREQWGERAERIFEKFPSLYLFFDWEHPTSKERAQTFADRLVKILNESEGPEPEKA